MENISKALMISAGILFAILILTLLIIFFNQMSSYYSEQNKAKMVEQVTEFNSKFDNYSGKTIRGNELISVMNRVVDYNRTYSDIDGAERITISIDLKNHQNDFLYGEYNNNTRLFDSGTISNQNGNDDRINRIANASADIVSTTGIDENKLQKLSAAISFVCNTSTDESDIEKRDEQIRKILGYSKNRNLSTNEITKIQKATSQYYQLTQFKRSMFNCINVVHSQNDGRVNRITFEILEENGAIKQD